MSVLSSVGCWERTIALIRSAGTKMLLSFFCCEIAQYLEGNNNFCTFRRKRFPMRQELMKEDLSIQDVKYLFLAKNQLSGISYSQKACRVTNRSREKGNQVLDSSPTKFSCCDRFCYCKRHLLVHDTVTYVKNKCA